MSSIIKLFSYLRKGVVLPLYITSGEPAGIGPDICLNLADRIDERPTVVFGS